MLVRGKRSFNVGIVFAITFLGVLLLIFSPVFSGKSGLRYADDVFNRLSKGSSYFIPKVEKTAEKYVGTPLSAKIKLDGAEDAADTARLFAAAGARVEVAGADLAIEGDLGLILKSALWDADAMFRNDGAAVSERYGYEEKRAMKNWWAALSKVEKSLKKKKSVEAAKAVSDVNKKAVEPGYNFYRIESDRVSERAGMMTGLLVFYVAYTMWWGFAIYYLFEGLGLTMKKAKIKKEA